MKTFNDNAGRTWTVAINVDCIEKEGWQYLWVRFSDEEDNVAKTLIKKSIAAYVERVYEYGDFSSLGIGT